MLQQVQGPCFQGWKAIFGWVTVPCCRPSLPSRGHCQGITGTTTRAPGSASSAGSPGSWNGADECILGLSLPSERLTIRCLLKVGQVRPTKPLTEAVMRLKPQTVSSEWLDSACQLPKAKMLTADFGLTEIP